MLRDDGLTAAARTIELAKAIEGPALAQPGWYRLVGQTHHDERKELSPEGQRIAARKQRKAQRQNRRGPRALLTAIMQPHRHVR